MQGDTTFGTTTSFGIGDINGVPTQVLHFIPTSFQWGGYVMTHGAAPNGGGSYVNQYTLIYDIYFRGARIELGVPCGRPLPATGTTVICSSATRVAATASASAASMTAS